MADSTILKIPLVAPNQTNKESTINTAISILERAMNDVATVDTTAGDVVLTQTDFTRYGLFQSTPNAARIITFPSIKRIFAVRNKATTVGHTLAVTIDGSTTDASIVVPPETTILFVCDGDTANPNLYKLADSSVAAVGTSAFLSLTDTPGSYTGHAGKAVVVNVGETGLEFGTLALDFTDLGDTPADYTGHADKAVYVNAAGTGLEFRDLVLGAETFTTLTDTPNSFVGQAGRAVRVNGAATGLEFYDPSNVVVTESRVVGLLNPSFEDLLGAVWIPSSVGAWTRSVSGGTPLGSIAAADDLDAYVWFSGAASPVEAPGAHRYWRIDFVDSRSLNAISLAEVELHETVGGADETGSGTASASSGTAANAFDNDDATFWTAGATGAQSLTYDFGEGVTKEIMEVAIRATNDATFNDGPSEGDVKWSDDGVTWFDAWNFVVLTDWSSGEIRSFNLVVPDKPTLTQTYSLLLDATALELVDAEIILSFAAQTIDRTDPLTEPPYKGRVSLQFLDASDAVIETFNSGEFHNVGSWITYVVRTMIPADAQTVNVILEARPTSDGQSAYAFDHLEAELRVVANPVTSFISLDDTPASYVGQDNKYLRVQNNGDGTYSLIFVDSVAGTVDVQDGALGTPVSVTKVIFDTTDFDVTDNADGSVTVAYTAIPTIDVQLGAGAPFAIDRLIFDASDFSLTDNGDGTATLAFTGTAAAVLDVQEGTSGTPFSVSKIIFEDNAFTITDNGDGTATVKALVTVVTDATANHNLGVDAPNKYIRMTSGAANTVTVPTNATAAIPVGASVAIVQAGVGQTSIVASVGVTINTPETLKLRKAFSSATLTKVGTNEWDLIGDLEAAP